ncbi:hypothetical protein ACVWYG_003448 [Pedobacter sp. UYEF25]
MAIYKKGILGVFSGKVGTVIGASWKGIDYMRSLPKASRKTASTKQQDQRLKFALVTNFFGPVKYLITTGYQTAKGNFTPMNNAVSYHLREAVIGVSPDFTIDFPKVVFSKGELLSPWNAVAAATVAGKVDFSWTDNSTPAMGAALDKAIVIVYNPETNQYLLMENGATRADAEIVVDLPPNFEGDVVHCWMAFFAPDDSAASTSVYLGTVEVI